MKNSDHELLTPKLQEIISLVYRFRFINRIQLQEILEHKDPSRLNKWMAVLIKNDYVGRIYEPIQGKNKIPSIYYLKKKGIGYIRKAKQLNNPYINKLYREDIISLTTKNHSLKAVDFYLYLKRFAKEINAHFEYYTKANLAEKQYFPEVKPDAYFSFETYKGKRSCFIEIDMETESKATIRRKMKRYIDYHESHDWTGKTFPIVTTVSLTSARIEILMLELKELLKESDYPPILFKFSTFGNIEKFSLGNVIWNVALKEERTKLL